MREVVNTIEVELEGITYILMHKYVAGTASSGGGVKLPGVDSYAKEWIKGCYVSMKENGKDVMEKHIMIPDYVLRAMMNHGASGIKQGKHTARNLMACIQMDDTEYLIKHNGKTITVQNIEDNEWLDCRGVVIGKSRIDRIRAFVPTPWKLNFTINIINPICEPEVIKAVLEQCGWKSGIGDWRPGCKKPGSFGQFEVIKFEVK